MITRYAILHLALVAVLFAVAGYSSPAVASDEEFTLARNIAQSNMDLRIKKDFPAPSFITINPPLVVRHDEEHLYEFLYVINGDFTDLLGFMDGSNDRYYYLKADCAKQQIIVVELKDAEQISQAKAHFPQP